MSTGISFGGAMQLGKWQTLNQRRNNGWQGAYAQEEPRASLTCQPPIQSPPTLQHSRIPDSQSESYQGVVVSYLATPALLNDTPYTENKRRRLSGKTPIVM
jgi:hypothetical protein